METSCVAGIEEGGSVIRLFPVPFRLISNDQQFKKWQWISARIEKARDDHRPESHKLFVDTIRCEGRPIPTTSGWLARRDELNKLQTFFDFQALETARRSSGTTLAILKPLAVQALDISQSNSEDWTKNERDKLVQHERQVGLFDKNDAKGLATLRKLPFDFYYRYICNTRSGPFTYRHKILDWEAGALYWNCVTKHGSDWMTPFRNKLERDFSSKDLMFLMGTMHRFPDQWLIVSLIYPPREQAILTKQKDLFDD